MALVFGLDKDHPYTPDNYPWKDRDINPFTIQKIIPKTKKIVDSKLLKIINDKIKDSQIK